MNKKIARSHNKETEQHRQKKEKQAIVQLGFIVGSFALGYIPNSGNTVVHRGSGCQTMLVQGPRASGSSNSF